MDVVAIAVGDSLYDVVQPVAMYNVRTLKVGQRFESGQVFSRTD